VRRYLFLLVAGLYLVGLAAALIVALASARAGTAAAIIILWFALAAAGVLAAALLVQHYTRPLRDLTEAFRRAGQGDFAARVLPPRRGTVKEVADGFNQMAFRTKEMLDQLARQREALNAVIVSISEGLLVLDADGRVILANDSLRRLVGATPVDGRYYWEVIREPAFTDLVKAVAAGHSSASGEVEFAGRILSCSASYLPSADETVVTLHDITQVARAAQLKREFVVSVSHELRTPLTAIKGYVETMEETIDAANRPYLDIVKRHTDRLVGMVADLLTLSELEEKGLTLHLEAVDLPALAGATLKLFERAAQTKGLSLKLRQEPDLPRLQADAFKLEQVLVNLLDNAVKYTDSGEVVVSISLDPSNPRSLVLTVSDTGIGIAPEHLPRLFERFYVVDKSRSRAMGGTGLGLAIVKHIVLLHGGDVTVESTPGAGTAVRVVLPVASSPQSS
jgi:two-component system phosphate regulon sensor histidine kinase PhoR